MALAETGVEEQRLVELRDAEPAIEEESHRHLALGVALLVDLVEELGARLLGFGERRHLLVNVDPLLGEGVAPHVDAGLVAGPVAPDVASLDGLGLGVRDAAEATDG
ncbi:hypothetical protein [Streptomyces chartreusis]